MQLPPPTTIAEMYLAAILAQLQQLNETMETIITKRQQNDAQKAKK